MRLLRRASELVRSARRGLSGAADPLQGARMFEPHSMSMSDEVRGMMDMHRSPQVQKISPENVGSLLGADQQGIGGELDHLEGLEAEERRRSRLSQDIAKLFPTDAKPLPNAMQIATAPTHEELEMREDNEALKEAVRERYQRSVERREAEKRRKLEAERLAEEAYRGTQAPTTPPAPEAAVAQSKQQPQQQRTIPPTPRVIPTAAHPSPAPRVVPRPVVVPAPRELRAGASENEQKLHALQTDLAVRAADFDARLSELRMQAAALEIDRVAALVDGKREQLLLIAGELTALRSAPPEEPEPVEEPAEGEKVSMRERLVLKNLAQERQRFLKQRREMESELAVARLRVVELELEALGRELRERKEEVKRYCGTGP